MQISLAKIQVTAVVSLSKICGELFYQILERFVRRCHVGAHAEALQHDGRKPTETSVTEFC